MRTAARSTVGRRPRSLPALPPRPLHALALSLAALLLASCGGAPSPAATNTPSGTPAHTIAAGSATPAPPPVTPPPSTATPLPQAGDTGIDGFVTIGPTCPVERPDSPCPDRPFEATIDILDDQGRQVAAARSDAQGHFRVLLPPGTYTLQGRSATAPPYARPETATVTEGELTTVRIRFDSGIR
jgi:hypothetical protein